MRPLSATLLLAAWGGIALSAISGCNRQSPSSTVPLAHIEVAAPPVVVEESPEIPASPQHRAYLVVSLAPKGGNGPSISQTVGKLAERGHSAEASGSCEIVPLKVAYRLKYQSTENGVDRYQFEWTLEKDGNPFKGGTGLVQFDGHRQELASNEHLYVTLDTPPENLSSPK